MSEKRRIALAAGAGGLILAATQLSPVLAAGLSQETAAAEPRVVSVAPDVGATDVRRDETVVIKLSAPVDADTLRAGFSVSGPSGSKVAGYYGQDLDPSTATFIASRPLSPNTRYTVRTTSKLKLATGASYAAFTSTFTTGTKRTPATGVKLKRSVFAETSGVTVMTQGPGNVLYAGTTSGSILQYRLDDAGMPAGSPTEITAFKGSRLITGLHMDPRSTARRPVLWVSSGALCGSGCENFTGVISVLTGNGAPTTRRDVIVGLPRSVTQNMTNGIDFGPDGRLYIAQGSMTDYGAADAASGERGETPLSASVLVADVTRDQRFARTVNVDTSAGYDPDADNAPVRVHASGLRNAFTLLWHSTGKLYTAVNQATTGTSPAGPGNTPPAINGVSDYSDYFTRVVHGAYYGHPNPSQGTYRLNGGNPTAGQDPFEVREYPVGTAPEGTWREPDLDLGAHRSPNGLTEVTSEVYGPALQGRVLVTELSRGKDLIAVKLNARGRAVSKSVLATGFYNPIAVVNDHDSGRIYVSEYGSFPGGTGGKITLLTPA